MNYLLRFRGSLATIANVSDHAKCISLDNQPYMTRPILTNLNPDKYNYGPFIINWDRCNGNCIILDDPWKRKYKFEYFQYDDKNKFRQNINKTYIMWMYM